MKSIRQRNSQRSIALVTIIFFAAVGAGTLIYSLAAPFTVAVETEGGTLAGATQKVADANASGGQAVKFAQDVPQDVVVAFAGDIQEPNSGLHYGSDTANLILNQIHPDYVLAGGDLQYEDGSLSNFNNYYSRTWGQPAIKSITYPSPGNHEYYTSGATGYYSYFNAGNNTINGKTVTGPAQQSYYAFNIGSNWRAYSLNSEIDASAQDTFVANDMAANPKPCTLMFFHKPYYDYGTTHSGDADGMQSVYNTFYDKGGDLVLTGHEHNYQRFKPVNPHDDSIDNARGLLNFVVGTGGNSGLYDAFGSTDHNAKNLITTYNGTSAWGVLKLTFHANSYDWEFVPTNSNAYTDSGSAQCH